MYYGKKVILRGMDVEDASLFLKKWNTLELRRYLSVKLPVSLEQEEKWIRMGWEGMQKGTGYPFVVTDYEGRFLGTVSLFSVDKINRSAELGIAIHETNNRGKGYGTDAVITMCAFGFKIINLHRIYLSYIDGNPGSKAYYNAGFTEIGRHRDAIYNLGKYVDLIYMDILKDEFMEKFPEYTLFSPE